MNPGQRVATVALSVVVAVTIAVGESVAAQDSPTAPLIDTVIVENANIFDERDRSFMARWANALHITTSPWVIRRTIFVRPGEPYDSARVVESERALRALGVFRDASIDTLHVDGHFAVRVRTADGWSTRPIASLSATAGDATWAVGFSELNLLGSATALGFAYRKTPDRAGYELEFLNQQFLVRGLLLHLRYRNYSDGERGEWILGPPFRESRSRWSLQTYGGDAQERVLVFRDGAQVLAVQRRLTVLATRGGYALTAGSRGYARLWMDAQWRREDFAADTASGTSYTAFGAVGAGVELAHVRYTVVRQLNGFGRSEDIDLSTMLRVGAWAAPRAWGYPGARAGAGPEVSGQIGFPWHGGFGLVQASGRGIYGSAGLDSGRVQGSVFLVSQNLPRQSLVLYAEGAVAERPAPGGEFDPWLTQRGPRLFGAHAFTGTRLAWGTLEDRVLLGREWLGLVGVGLAPFVDWGGAWYADQPARTGGDVGLSLRMGSTRSVHGSVTEFAGGYRFGAGWTGRRWAVTLRTGLRL